MVWDIGLRSHNIADMVWVLNGMSYRIGYPWDVSWDGMFLGHPIGMLFLEVHLGVTLLAAVARKYWEPHLGATF